MSAHSSKTPAARSRRRAGSAPPVCIYVVALMDGLLSTVAGPLEVFRLAGLSAQTLTTASQAPLFHVRVVGWPGALQSFGEVGLQVADIAGLPRPDLVFVGSGGLHTDSVAQAHAGLGQLLRRWHQAGSVVAGVCTGVIVLAECGLLDGRRATTHWAVADWFRHRYPQVNLCEQAMVTQDSRVWCGAGGHASQDLALQLAAHFVGPEAARQASQTLLLDAPRGHQTPYAVSAGAQTHDAPLVARVQRHLALNLAQVVAVPALAQVACLSARSLMRRFREATGTTVLNYQQGLRIEEAKRLLVHSGERVVDIGAGVGYQDPAFFRALFKRKVGWTPSEYRRRFAATPAELAVR